MPILAAQPVKLITPGPVDGFGFVGGPVRGGAAPVWAACGATTDQLAANHPLRWSSGWASGWQHAGAGVVRVMEMLQSDITGESIALSYHN